MTLVSMSLYFPPLPPTDRFLRRGRVSRFVSFPEAPRSVRFVLAFAVALWAPFCSSARGDGEPATTSTASAAVTIDGIDVGFHGRFKVGRWTPVTAHISATGPAKVRPIFEVSDPDGNATSMAGESADLVTSGTHVLRGMFKSGRIDSSLRVIVEDTANGNARLAERLFHVAASSEIDAAKGGFPRALTLEPILVATLGRPAGFSHIESIEIESKLEQSSDRNAEPPHERTPTGFLAVELDSAEQLPQDSIGLDSLDALVVAGQFDFEHSTSEALRNWVRLGGHLVVSVGNHVDEYQKSPLAKWVPVSVTGTAAVRDLSGLESYAGKGARIDFRGGLTAPAARIGSVQGVVEVNAGIDGPILVNVPFGFGRVTFLSLDLAGDPLAHWPGTADLVRRIIHVDRTGTPIAGAPDGRAMLTHTGITEMATQLHAAQDHFPQIERFSMWTVMGFLALYLSIIGPLDYLFVHRILRRPGLTWVTFPVIVAVAAALGVWAAGRSNGEAMRLNQLDLIDIDAESHVVRSRTWMMLYSPETARYEVAVAPKALSATEPSAAGNVQPVANSARPRVMWNGVPENSYSGMYRLGGFEIARAAYSIAENASAIENLPIPIWSTKGLTASWQTEAANLAESDLSSSSSVGLTGTIVHHLAAPLEDWMIAYGKIVYIPVPNQFSPEAAQLRPGRKLTLSANAAGLRRRDLNGFLTGLQRKTITHEKKLEEYVVVDKRPYEPLGRNADDIFRILTFFNRAGGKSYTTLDNNEFRSLDLSGLLDLKRAVLFGKIAARSADVEVNGEKTEPTRSSAYVRIVLPVKDASSAYGNTLSERNP